MKMRSLILLLLICHLICLPPANQILVFAAAATVTGKMPEEGEELQNVLIVVDPLHNLLTVYVEGRIYKRYPIALGKEETPTPVGDFVVISKHKN